MAKVEKVQFPKSQESGSKMTREVAGRLLASARSGLTRTLAGEAKVDIGRGTYDVDSGTVSFKVTLTLPTAKGRDEVEWERYAESLLDLDPTWLGRKFRTSSRRHVRVVGLNMRKRKNQVMLEELHADGRVTGKRLMCTPDALRAWTLLDD